MPRCGVALNIREAKAPLWPGHPAIMGGARYTLRAVAEVPVRKEEDIATGPGLRWGQNESDPTPGARHGHKGRACSMVGELALVHESLANERETGRGLALCGGGNRDWRNCSLDMACTWIQARAGCALGAGCGQCPDFGVVRTGHGPVRGPSESLFRWGVGPFAELRGTLLGPATAVLRLAEERILDSRTFQCASREKESGTSMTGQESLASGRDGRRRELRAGGCGPRSGARKGAFKEDAASAPVDGCP